MSSLLVSDSLSCLELIEDLDLVGLNVFFIALEKFRRFRFSLRSFCVAYRLGIGSFVWIWKISVTVLNFWAVP